MGQLDALADAAMNAAMEDWSSKAQPRWKDVVASANTFLTAYSSYKTDAAFNANFRTSMMSVGEQLKNTLTADLNKDTIKSARQKIDQVKRLLTNKRANVGLRAVYLLAFRFQNQYQRCIGLIPSKVQYVSPDGTIHETEMQWLALTATKLPNQSSQLGLKVSGQLGLNRFYTQLLDIDDNMKQQYTQILEAIDAYFNAIDNVFKNQSSDIKLQSGFYYEQPVSKTEKIVLQKKQVAYLKLGNTFLRVLNKGDTSEGYAYAIKHNLQTLNGILEGILQVDNASGFLSQDLEDVAVKSPNASLPDLQPFVKAAEAVQSSQHKKIKEEAMRAILKDRSAVRNLINEAAESALDKSGIDTVLTPYGTSVRDIVAALN